MPGRASSHGVSRETLTHGRAFTPRICEQLPPQRTRPEEPVLSDEFPPRPRVLLLQVMPSTIYRPSRRASGDQQLPRNDQRPPTTTGESVALADHTDAADGQPSPTPTPELGRHRRIAPARTHSPARLAMTVGRARTARVPLNETPSLFLTGCWHCEPNNDDQCSGTILPRGWPASAPSPPHSSPPRSATADRRGARGGTDRRPHRRT